jgi:putative hemolysin
MNGAPVFELVVIGVLILVNGLFAASEMGLVTVRTHRLEQRAAEGNRAAARVLKLKRNPNRFLAVIQIGITFIGFLAAAFAGVSLADGLEQVLEETPFLKPYAGAIALITVTGILTLFTIIFGELVPKAIGLAHSERVALVSSGPVDLLGRVFAPIVFILTWATHRVAGLFGADVTQEDRVSADEIRLLIERGGEQGILEAEEEQMINAVIELGDRRLHEVMVPRIAIVALPASATFEHVIETIIEEGHSRVPVYETSVDEVIGILYAKDLLRFLKAAAVEPPDLRTLLRTPVFVPESMTIDDLLHEFQRRKVHIAIVLDEYGGTAGLVTIEDLLEEIVGEIQDEYDVEEPLVESLGEDRARVDGRASVDDLLDVFDLRLTLEDEEEYDTVGGLVYHRIGGVPVPGDEVQVDGLRLTVETTDGRRVGKVMVVRERKVDDESAEGEE